MRRRTLLKLGLAGTALVAAGGAAILAGRDPVRDRAAVLGAVAPVLLEGALPAAGPARDAALRRTVDDVVVAIGALAPAAQDELARLFALLGSAPGRRLLAGVGDDWPRADRGEVAAFLEGWRLHRSATLRAGYGALHDLVLGAWYAHPSTWSDIGYGGPLHL
jgi:hypothetical protein